MVGYFYCCAARRMLEVGCAEGELGRYSREHKIFEELVGIETRPAAAGRARQWYDAVYNADVEDFDCSLVPPVDAIIVADVLELVDP